MGGLPQAFSRPEQAAHNVGITEQEAAMAQKNSVIKSKFLSHGTLGSTDLERTRQFYEEFLGLEVVRTSKISMMIRLGGEHVYAVVKRNHLEEMDRINHNGIDVDSDDDVNAAWDACNDQAEKWGLYSITKPVFQHGTYSFHFKDGDGNAWEILSNPKGGYQWIFEQGDLEGKGHFDKNIRDKIPEELKTGG
jgi:catechol 2,3-dioxygenase-like lactoylglutathione lyase family enzyme